MATPLIDLKGKRFGRWEVLDRIGDESPPIWFCVCDCGNGRPVRGYVLRAGQSESCGCIGGERFKALDQRGDRNPMRKKMLETHDRLLPVGHPWFNRAQAIQQRCRMNGLEFGFFSAAECAAYLDSITPEFCPALGIRLEKGANGFNPASPSADRKTPAHGYVRGNIQVLSMKANTMKHNATTEELQRFARWVLGQ